MSEKKLKDAFEQLGPDEAARQRMFENILLAHEAGSDEHVQLAEQLAEQPDLRFVEQTVELSAGQLAEQPDTPSVAVPVSSRRRSRRGGCPAIRPYNPARRC